MAIEKMRYVYFVGEKDYLEDFINKYLIDDYEIQPENAVGALNNVHGLYSYKGTNPCIELIRKCDYLMQNLGIKEAEVSNVNGLNIGFDEIEEFLQNTEEGFKYYKEEKQKVDNYVTERKKLREQLKDISTMDVDLSKLFSLRFFKIRFGRIPAVYYERLNLYTKELDVILFNISSNKDYEHILYIVPDENASQVDGLFNSLQFERIRISDGLSGTPKEIQSGLDEEIRVASLRQIELTSAIAAFASDKAGKLLICRKILQDRNRTYEISKYAGFNKKSFYIIGWMPEKELQRLQAVIDKDPKVITIADPADELKKGAPTKLKNNALVKPFETIVKMYGMPSYDEIDPTPIIALVYSLMVGMMFGDVGQGFIFLIAGIILLRKGSALGGVFTGGGISAMIFGMLYGSIFSMENIIKPIFMNPIESANINTMLVLGIGLGCVLLVAGMILNIANGIKSREIGRVLFDRNGLAGLLFYGIIIFTVVLYFIKGKLWISSGILALLILIPFVIIFFRHPLENIIHKKSFLPKDKAGFFIETFFEMVDMLLSFASNTISFVRISAFAINHVGLSMAVLILSEMGSGIGKVIIMIIGNALIICLEGLIVGIQGLRLVYYEMFSRFFKGSGREYMPIGKEIKN